MTPEQTKQFIIESRQKGIQDKDIYTYLQNKNVIAQTETQTVTSEPSALQNVNKSAKDFSTGFTSSYLKPLQNLGNAILNPVKKAFGLEDVKTGLDERVYEPQSTSEKVGNVVGEVSQFFIPAGSINKARQAVNLYKGEKLVDALSKIGITNPKTINTIVSGGKLALESLIEGGSSAAITAAQTGGFGDEAKVSGAIGASMPIIGKGFNLLKKAEVPVLSFTSGVPQKALEEAQKARPSINIGVKSSVEDIQKKAVDALSNPETGLRKQLSENFSSGLKQIQDKYKIGLHKSAQDAAQSFKDNLVAQLENRGAKEAAERIRTGFDPASINAFSQIQKKADEVLGNLANFPLVKEATDNWNKTARQVYDFTRGSEDLINAQNSLKDAIVSNLRQFKIGVKKGVPEFGRSAIVKSGEQENIKQVLNTVSTWKDFSPEGMQSLMSRLGALSKFDTPKGNQTSAVIGKMYNDTKTKLVNKFYPELADLRTNFDNTNKVLNEIGSVIGESAKKPVNVQSAVTRLSNLFKEDKETYLNAVRELSNRSGVDILGLLAGTEFKNILPQFQGGRISAGAVGIGSVLNPYLLLLSPLVSPRAVKNIVAPSAKTKKIIDTGVEVGKKLLESLPVTTD